MGAGALVKQAEKVEEDNPSLWWDPYFEWEADAMALAYARWAVEKPEECARGVEIYPSHRLRDGRRAETERIRLV